MYILVLLNFLGDLSTDVAVYDTKADCLEIKSAFVFAAPHMETMLTCEGVK